MAVLKCSWCTQKFTSAHGRSNHERKCNKINNIKWVLQLQAIQRAAQRHKLADVSNPPINDVDSQAGNPPGSSLMDEERHDTGNMDIDTTAPSETSPVCLSPTLLMSPLNNVTVGKL